MHHAGSQWSGFSHEIWLLNGMTYHFLFYFHFISFFFTNLAECSIGIMYLKVKKMVILIFHRFLKSKFSDALFMPKIVAFLTFPKVIAIQSVSIFCSLIESKAKFRYCEVTKFDNDLPLLLTFNQ